MPNVQDSGECTGDGQCEVSQNNERFCRGGLRWRSDHNRWPELSGRLNISMNIPVVSRATIITNTLHCVTMSSHAGSKKIKNLDTFESTMLFNQNRVHCSKSTVWVFLPCNAMQCWLRHYCPPPLHCQPHSGFLRILTSKNFSREIILGTFEMHRHL